MICCDSGAKAECVLLSCLAFRLGLTVCPKSRRLPRGAAWPKNCGGALVSQRPSSDESAVSSAGAMQSSANDLKLTYIFGLKRLRRIKSRPESTSITSIRLTERNIEFHNDRVEEEDASYNIQRTREVQVSKWLRLLP